MNRPASAGQPWIGSAGFDCALISGPGIAAALVALVLPGDALAPWQWLLLVVGIDVAHVYATLFRTYLDKAELAARAGLYLFAPIACFALGVILYSADPMWFWRVLAYLAVYHFIRQQYGFMMIYGRFERDLPGWCKRIDQTAIYAATLHPLIAWHLNPRAFSWFIDGDFVSIRTGDWAAWLNHGVGIAVALAWIAKEIWLRRAGRAFNRPRALLLGSTAISWHVGIVALNSDLAFTATNVVAHGIPYLALTFLFERKREAFGRSALPGLFRRAAPAAGLFLGLLLLLAFVEEGLWDTLVWREHGGLFPGFGWLGALVEHPPLWLLVPLLSLPQAVHYVLDAVIWRRDLAGNDWPRILFGKPA